MEMKATVEAEAKETAKATMRADRLAQTLRRAPPPEAVMPEKLAAQAGPTQARPAQDLMAQAETRAARLLMVYDEWMAKAAKTVAARPRRIKERRGARPPPPVHVAALPRCAASWSFLVVV
jgi:hypothetical protein